jgi:hypothetical protein
VGCNKCGIVVFSCGIPKSVGSINISTRPSPELPGGHLPQSHNSRELFLQTLFIEIRAQGNTGYYTSIVTLMNNNTYFYCFLLRGARITGSLGGAFF